MSRFENESPRTVKLSPKRLTWLVRTNKDRIGEIAIDPNWTKSERPRPGVRGKRRHDQLTGNRRKSAGANWSPIIFLEIF